MFIIKSSHSGLVFLLLCILLSACGPSPEELTATSAAATTITPTISPTLPPTYTPTPTPVPLLSPLARAYHQMAYDIESDRAILFGGEGIIKGMLEDTWAYDFSANSWVEMTPAQSPPPGNGSMAYDIQSDRVILYMGVIDTGTYPDNRVYKLTSETWAYDYNSNTWVDMQPKDAPFGLLGARMVYDAESDRMILFGGMDAGILIGADDKFFDDTWAYDFDSNNWTKMKPAVSPPASNYFPMAYDVSSDRIVLMGGDPAGDNDMWSYDYNEDTWVKLKPGESPSLRTYCDMVYDSQSDRMILFGGTMLHIKRNSPLGETWAYHLDTDTWTELNPATSPGKRGWYAAVYSTKADRVILFSGGTRRTTAVNETWIYDLEANTWTNVTLTP